jgi:hypothetical protein
VFFVDPVAATSAAQTLVNHQNLGGQIATQIPVSYYATKIITALLRSRWFTWINQDSLPAAKRAFAVAVSFMSALGVHGLWNYASDGTLDIHITGLTLAAVVAGLTHAGASFAFQQHFFDLQTLVDAAAKILTQSQSTAQTIGAPVVSTPKPVS